MFITNIQKNLPYFPVPYPDECLYSVIARYHARSGNPALKYSLQDLFGRSNITNISSAITTPYHLSASSTDCWGVNGTGYTKECLVRDHTAFQFYVIRRSFKEVMADDPELIKPSIQLTLIHESGKLRYCPCCAKEQSIVYGEPYWQRLPQLKGAEYCPIHSIPYVNSSIDVKTAAYHAVTAAFAIRKSCSDKDCLVSVSSSMENIYIKSSRDMNWLLNNGYKVQDIHKTLQTIAQAFSLRDVWGRKIEELALGYLPVEYVHKVFPCFRQKGYRYAYNQMRTITPHQVATLMGITAGSAEKFAQIRL